VIHGVQTFLPILKANQDGGHIVNTASIGAFLSAPKAAAYLVTKFGVLALTETLALELAEEGSNVGASALCPGPVKTSISTSLRNRPADAGVCGMYDVRSEDMGVFVGEVPYISPQATGDLVIDSIKRGDLYIFTHPEEALWAKGRNDLIEKAAMDAIRRQGAR
jgi:short-subunit dehydrogenase